MSVRQRVPPNSPKLDSPESEDHLAGTEKQVMSGIQEALKYERGVKEASVQTAFAPAAHRDRAVATIRVSTWRAWLSVFLALMFVVASVPVTAAHGNDSTGSVAPAGKERVFAQSADSTDSHSTTWHKMHGQHGILCACSHAVPPGIGDPSACRYVVQITYGSLRESLALPFAPPPLLRPPRG